MSSLFPLLVMRGKIASVDFRPMYITVVSILLFSILDRLETSITSDPTCYVPRLILSVVCYWIRPIFCLGLIFVIENERKKWFLISIPELINIVVMGLAFVPGIGRYVFYFDDEFCFQRGPLGFTVFAVCFAYILILVYLVFFLLREKMAKESLLIMACAVSIVIGSLSVWSSEQNLFALPEIMV